MAENPYESPQNETEARRKSLLWPAGLLFVFSLGILLVLIMFLRVSAPVAQPTATGPRPTTAIPAEPEQLEPEASESPEQNR